MVMVADLEMLDSEPGSALAGDMCEPLQSPAASEGRRC